MADPAQGAQLLAASGVLVREEPMAVATLRYFTRTGEFAEAVRAAAGVELPAALAAVCAPDGKLTLAWRSPTETLCLTPEAARIVELTSRLSGSLDGCLVDLSGAFRVLRLTGPRIAELLCRLGSTASVPQPGETRRSRLADVAVLDLSLRPEETLLVIERSLLPHVLAWIDATLADFDFVSA
jgi:heterotetrameric sarcosine oxidase gamma subunit